MKTTKYEYVEKRTKRVVVVHDVPVAQKLEVGVGFSMQTARELEKIVDYALAAKLPRVEVWFPTKKKAA